jgi:hypothetical protein
MQPNLLAIRAARQPAEVVLLGIKPEDKNASTSLRAGENLVRLAKESGLSIDNYLRLAVDPNAGQFKDSKMDGYECALAYLDLPVRDDFSSGVLLQAAAETFNTFPGSRALFPPVIDNILQWKYRQDQIENVGAIVSQSRTISGNEMISYVVDDKAGDYQQTGVIVEGSVAASSSPTSSSGARASTSSRRMQLACSAKSRSARRQSPRRSCSTVTARPHTARLRS